MERGSSRFDPKRGQQEVAGEFYEPDSEGTVFESAGWVEQPPAVGLGTLTSSKSVQTTCAVIMLPCGP